MSHKKEAIAAEFLRLVEIFEKLRSPDGCSWDRKQTHQSLAKHVREEAEEVVEAIDSGDVLHLVEELGDLLMQVVFHAQIGSENGTFDMEDVSRGICEKLISRHPHVFGSAERGIAPEQVLEMWGELKSKEKAERKRLAHRMKESLNFPSAIRLTEKIQAEAASVGFDFSSAEQAFLKIREEVEEVEELMAKKEAHAAKMQEEIGDLLFSVINVTRLLQIDAESCLRKASEKFVERFARVEELVEKDGGFSGKNLEELDKYWDRIKTEKD